MQAIDYVQLNKRQKCMLSIEIVAFEEGREFIGQDPR